MLKIFLVEDERVIREGIKKMPWEKEGFSFVGEAGDGELAYPQIIEKKPDILITDIRMPFMDGIELSRLVKEKLPETKVIFLSGHNEFEYAKEAISIGVTDYLLKPINASQLMEAVRRVADTVEKDRENRQMLEQYHQEMQRDQEQDKRRLFSALIHNELSLREIMERGEALGLDFTAAYMAVVIFTQSAPLGDNRNAKAMEKAEEAVRSLMKEEGCLRFEWSENTWIFIVKGESEERLKEKLNVCRENILQTMAAFPKLLYFGGIGPAVQRPRDLRKSYQEANKAFATRFFTSDNLMIDYTEAEEHMQMKEADINLQDLDVSGIDRRKIERFLKEGTTDEAAHFVKEYFGNIGEENYNSTLFRQYVMMDIYFCALGFLKEIGVDASELSEECQQVNKMVSHVHNIQEAKEYIGRLFRDVLELRDRHARKKYKDLIQSSMDYIQGHYQDSDISLNVVASYVNISPSYFSSMFSQETGRTFVEYLTSVRMDRAKELLRCTNKRSSEIAEEVGYQDSHYFSFLFKKTCGCTPSDYRRQKKEEP